MNVQRITRLTDGENTYDRKWRRVITPDDDVNDLANILSVSAAVANVLKDIVLAARYPQAVARYEARKAAQEV